MQVKIFAPNLPEEMIHSFQVLPDGENLQALIECLCWFFEEGSMQCCLGNENHPQHAAVEAHNMSVVQPVHTAAPDADPFVVGEPCYIPLPEECYDGQVEWNRGI